MAKAATPKKTTKSAPSVASAKVKVAAKQAAPAKKAPPAKKVVAAVKHAAPAKKVAPAAKHAPAKKATAPVKKVAPAAKPAPAKKATAPVKKVAPAAKPALAKKATAPLKKVAPAAKPAPAKKAAAAKVATPAKPAAKAEVAKKPARKPSTVICPLSGFEVKPEKPGLSPKTLERLEASLLEERARHVAQAQQMAADAEQLANEREGGDTQFDEESGEGDTINIERERDLLLSASAQQIVDDIDLALERIADKTYGVCLPAGRRINLERLEALPYAETCVDCKARAERRR
jgi:RNA polymerase-binding transcription factor DksA